MLRQAEKEREKMKKIVTLKLNFNMGKKFLVKDHSAISITSFYALQKHGKFIL